MVGCDQNCCQGRQCACSDEDPPLDTFKVIVITALIIAVCIGVTIVAVLL